MPSTTSELMAGLSEDRFVATRVASHTAYGYPSKVGRINEIISLDANPYELNYTATDSTLAVVKYSKKHLSSTSTLNQYTQTRRIFLEQADFTRVFHSLHCLFSPADSSEEKLYGHAEDILDLFENDILADREILPELLDLIPDSSKHILLSLLCDREFKTNSVLLINIVAGFLASECKRLAQAAASFLCICAGSIGTYTLDQIINKVSIKHKDLICGIASIYY